MKKILPLILALLSSLTIAQTFPVQNLQVNGTSSFGGAMSGSGLTSHDAGINHVQTVATISALRATNCVPGLMYQTQGYYTSADRASGLYVCNGSDTTTADNGGTIIAAANSFRLYLQYDGPLPVKLFGAKGDGTTNDTVAIQNAITSLIRNGGWGTMWLEPGHVYNFTSLSMDGILGLQFKGGNGGNVGNLSGSSSGGAAALNCTATTGDCIAYTGVAYHAAQVVFEDIAIYGNTTGYVLSFNNISQINFNRVSVSNAGGTTQTTGNGIHLSNTYYVFANDLYVWKTGTLYTAGQGIVIDKGPLSVFLGGLYNFTNTSIAQFSVGIKAGDSTPGTGGVTGTCAGVYEKYASINYSNSELNGNSQGAVLLCGVESASFTGNYLEGNLNSAFTISNQAQGVTIQHNFFNDFSASIADIQVGQNGSGTAYNQFYSIDISNNYFLAVKNFGVLASGGAGAGMNVEGNMMILGTSGAVGVGSNQLAAGNMVSTASNNKFYGFAAGTSMSGFFTKQADNFEYDTAGALIGAWTQAQTSYPSFATFTQIQANDPDTMVITNTTAAARLINATVATSKNRREFVTLTAASSQNLLIDKADATTLMCTLLPGKMAIVWNDGANEYCSLMP